MVLTHPIPVKPPDEDDFDEGGEYTGGENPYRKPSPSQPPIEEEPPIQHEPIEKTPEEVEETVETKEPGVGQFYTVKAYQGYWRREEDCI